MTIGIGAVFDAGKSLYPAYKKPAGKLHVLDARCCCQAQFMHQYQDQITKLNPAVTACSMQHRTPVNYESRSAQDDIAYQGSHHLV